MLFSQRARVEGTSARALSPSHSLCRPLSQLSPIELLDLSARVAREKNSPSSAVCLDEYVLESSRRKEREKDRLGKGGFPPEALLPRWRVPFSALSPLLKAGLKAKKEPSSKDNTRRQL